MKIKIVEKALWVESGRLSGVGGYCIGGGAIDQRIRRCGVAQGAGADAVNGDEQRALRRVVYGQGEGAVELWQAAATVATVGL